MSLLSCFSAGGWLSVRLFLWMNDLTNVLGLLAQSRALSVPVTVVSILLSPAPPVAVHLHANRLQCPAVTTHLDPAL